MSLVVAAGCGRVGFAAGAPDGTPPATTFCETVTPAPTFCADFDAAAAITPYGYTEAFSVNGGAIDLGDVTTSPPHALAASYGAPPDDTMFAAAFLRFTDARTIATLDLAYDLQIPTRPAYGEWENNNLTISVPGGAHFYQDLTIDGNNPTDNYREESEPTPGNFTTHRTPIPPITPDAWHHVHYTLDLAARQYSLTIDEAVVASGPTAFAIEPTPIALESGLNFISGAPSSGGTMDVDNVVLRATP